MTADQNDTIVAISTPPGEGGIGIVRMSGSDSFEIAGAIFTRFQKRENKKRINDEGFIPRSRRLYYGYILDEEDQELDEVLISFMPAPYTYTCEDIVEINAHGGIVPLSNILKLIRRKGVRLAEPGEFTKRAFLNGRIDLMQAESVLALINSRTERGLCSSIQGLKGFLSKEVEEIQAELLHVLAIIEADADFPLEDLELTDDTSFKDSLEQLITKAESLYRRSNQGRILQEGLKTVITGKPNVGKSSLYNYLLKEDRAIVTDVPGTTRDLLSEYINLRGIPLRLMDTAGLRQNGDQIENIGMDFSRRAIAEADLIIFMIDLSVEPDEEDKWIFDNLPHQQGQKIIIAGNKIDQGRMANAEMLKALCPGQQIIAISIKTGEGMEQLEEKIFNTVFSGGVGSEEGTLIMVARQAALIEELVAKLKDAHAAALQHLPPDLVSIDLREAHSILQKLLGKEMTADLLDHIFKNFCIGK